MQSQYNTRSPAVKRLMREAQELAEATYDYYAQPLSDNLFEWHFTVRGPADTEFDGGIYHGRIVLPPDYPMKPPNFIFLTPNGRFETGKKICLSISGHHPESWQPSWSIRTALLAIIGFMPTPSQGTIGSLDYPVEERKKLAKKSLGFVSPVCGPVAGLLKAQKENVTSTAEEAKEIIKTMSIKGENDNKLATTEETEEEKYKRARKLYSQRMQAKIKKKLCQNQSGERPQGQTAVQPPVQPQPVVVQPRRPQVVVANTETTHSVLYDFVIALIIVVIGVLIYRRFSIYSGSEPTVQPPTQPPTEEDLL